MTRNDSVLVLFGRAMCETCGYCGITFPSGPKPRAFCSQAHYFAFSRLPLARQIRRSFNLPKLKEMAA